MKNIEEDKRAAESEMALIMKRFVMKHQDSIKTMAVSSYWGSNENMDDLQPGIIIDIT